MKFLADMGISVSTARRLRDHGYDAVHPYPPNFSTFLPSEAATSKRAPS
jgi:hypothetical protein